MSITPLDLQTLFLKMANVGKEQAAIQKSVEHQQNKEADELVKKENNRDHTVNKTEEDKEVDKTRDGKGNPQNGNSSTNNQNKDEPENEKPNYFTDPKLGHNIDISG